MSQGRGRQEKAQGLDIPRAGREAQGSREER